MGRATIQLSPPGVGLRDRRPGIRLLESPANEMAMSRRVAGARHGCRVLLRVMVGAGPG
jgi:hypothetical protein